MFNDKNYDYNDNDYNFQYAFSYSDFQKEDNESQIFNIIDPIIGDKFQYQNDSLSLKYDLKNVKIVNSIDGTTKPTVEKLVEEKNIKLEEQNNNKSEIDDSFFDPAFKNIIYNDINDIKDLKQNLKSLEKKRGREGTTGAHNKFSDDNIRRKCKHIILNILFHFINKKIFQKYQNYSKCYEVKLLGINQKQKADASIQFNKEFLYKSIGDIFSDKISGRYSQFSPYHNKHMINFLKKDEEKDNIKYFQKIFSLSFLDCLKHFRGSIYITELDGMKDIDFLKDKFNGDEKYLKTLIYYFMNFEDIINNKKARKRKKKENIELNKEK